MNVKFQSIHFDADQKLLDHIEKKLQKVDNLFDNVVKYDVILKLENNEKKENKIVEIHVKIPNNELFASRQSRTFEAAADECIDALKIQINKYKEKLRNK